MSYLRISAVLAVLATSSCDSRVVDPGTTAALSIAVELAGGFTSFADQGRFHIEGPTSVAPVTLGRGESRTIENLRPGSYTVAVEGLLNGQVESFGETSVSVSAGVVTPVSVSLQSFVPIFNVLVSAVTAGGTIDVQWSAVPHAASYQIGRQSSSDGLSIFGFGTGTTSASIPADVPGEYSVWVRALTRFGTVGLSSPIHTVTAYAGVRKELLVSGIQSRVLRFDAETGALIDRFECCGSPVTGMAIGPDLQLYVGGGNDANVLRFGLARGNLIDEFVQIGPTFEDRPEDLLFTPEGDLLVAVGNCNGTVCGILRYDVPSGDFLGTLVPGNRNVAITGPEGDLYVYDPASNAVERRDVATGSLEEAFVTLEAFDYPYGMAFGPTGDLFLAQWNPSRIQRYDGATGELDAGFLATEIDLPYAIAFGPDGNLWAGSWETHDIRRFDPDTGALIDVFITPQAGLTKPTHLLFLEVVDLFQGVASGRSE